MGREETLLEHYGDNLPQKRREWALKGGKTRKKSWKNVSPEDRKKHMEPANKRRMELIKAGKEALKEVDNVG